VYCVQVVIIDIVRSTLEPSPTTSVLCGNVPEAAVKCRVDLTAFLLAIRSCLVTSSRTLIVMTTTGVDTSRHDHSTRVSIVSSKAINGPYFVLCFYNYFYIFYSGSDYFLAK